MKLKSLLWGVLTLINIPLAAQKLPVVIPESVQLNTLHLNNIDRVVNEAIELEEIPGAVVAIVKDNKIGYLKAFGNKQIYPSKETMQINTIFDLASCTKPLATAISTFILVDQGYISLQDPVNLYLPNFRDWKDEEGQVTIRIQDLLAHTSGLPAYAPVSTLKENNLQAMPDVLKKYIETCDLLYKPHSDMKYSCLNYITLQYIITKITNQSLAQFSKEHIYTPLQLQDTGFKPDESKIARVAPTELINDTTLLKGVVHDPLARELNYGISGNAGLFSTAEDVAVLANLFLNEGSSLGTRILSPASARVMTTQPYQFDSFGRGLGWDVSSPYANNQGDLFHLATFGHTGYTGTSVVIDKEDNLALIVLTNRAHPHDEGKVSRLRRLIANIVSASIGTANNKIYLAHYANRLKNFEKEGPINSKEIVLLGDSQIENGKNWGKLLKNRHVRNRGIVGDNTEGVLNRLTDIKRGKPKSLILTIGINDISQGLNLNTLVDNVENIIMQIEQATPKTKLFIQSILPINEEKNKYRLLKNKSRIIKDYNKRLELLSQKHKVTFINSYPLFLQEGHDDQLNPTITTDGLHLNQYGYKVWGNFLRKYIK